MSTAAVYDQVNSTSIPGLHPDVTLINGVSPQFYPTSDTYNILGPVYLPKVYGKDLSSFEIASSGYIAVTLNDVYAFNLTRDDATKTVQFNTTDDGNLLLSTGANAYVDLSAANSNVTLHAGSNIYATADTAFQVNAAGDAAVLLLEGSTSNVYLSALSNVSTAAVNQISSSAASGMASLVLDGTHSNAVLWASDVVDVKAAWTVYESAAGSNAVIILDGAHSNVYISSMSNIYTTCPNDFIMTCSNFILNGATFTAKAADNGDIMLAASNAYIHIYDSNIDYYAQNQMHFMVSNNTFYENKETFGLTTSLLDVGASNFHMHTISNLTVACSNLAYVVAKQMIVDVDTSADITSTGDLHVWSKSDAWLSSDHMLNITASNGVYVNAKNKFDLNGSWYTGNFQTYHIESSDYDAAITNDLYVSSGNDSTYAASNNFLAVGKTSVIVGNDDVKNTKMTMTSGVMTMQMTNVERLKVSDTGVKVIGLLEVDGEIQSINTYAENLEIYDKTITMAGGSNGGDFVDGLTTNHLSGMRIAGLPTGADFANEADKKLYEKSFLFNCPTENSITHLNDGTGVPSLTSFDTESFWELKGGDFRITNMKSDIDMVTFAFRVNAFDELELIKKYSVDGGQNFQNKVVSKFGRILSAL